MSLDADLTAFMNALGTMESGNRYHIRGPAHPKYGTPLGRFQIMSSNWDAWAREAGIPGADWRSPKAQDHVARFKILQYYRQFKDLKAVAIAWHAGPGRAQTYLKTGTLPSSVRDVNMHTLDYAARVMSLMGRPTSSPVDTSGGDSFPSGRLGQPGVTTTPEPASDPAMLPVGERVRRTISGWDSAFEDVVTPEPATAGV